MKIRNIMITTTILMVSALSGPSAYAASNDYFESVVVTFEKGRSQLSTEDLTTLNKAVKDAQVKGKIEKIEVAAWSDNQHPMTGSLSSSDQRLAGDRLDTVKRDLKRHIGKLKYVHEYNMATNSNWIARNLYTDKAKLDEAFAKNEATVPAREDFDLIKAEGAPSKAVVILKLERRK